VNDAGFAQVEGAHGTVDALDGRGYRDSVALDGMKLGQELIN